jgi:ferrous iron transport protein B
MELPSYKWPSPRIVLYRMAERGWSFVRRAGTLILASMIVVWALLYFPHTDAGGQSYDLLLSAKQDARDELEKEVESLEEAVAATPDADKQQRLTTVRDQANALDDEIHELQQTWKGQSYLGRAGKWLEPAVAPLGWDWRIGMAALASFPAREVMVGTLGLIFQQGEGDSGDESYRAGLGERLQEARWQDGSDRQLFNVPVALSIMVFFALCCQCASTLAVIKRETNSWRWPIFTFFYMTGLAYVAALLVYQLGALGS